MNGNAIIQKNIQISSAMEALKRNTTQYAMTKEDDENARFGNGQTQNICKAGLERQITQLRADLLELRKML